MREFKVSSSEKLKVFTGQGDIPQLLTIIKYKLDKYKYTGKYLPATEFMERQKSIVKTKKC